MFEEHKNNSTENQCLEQTHNDAQQRIHIGQMETVHKLHNYISYDNEKYGDEYEQCEEGKNQRHITVVYKLQEHFAQGTVKKKCTQETQSYDEEREELIYKTF